MPIFISYSHEDSAFVDTLARNLVNKRHNVWLDRWELGVGDSLTQTIQTALTSASAILIILSKTSVASDWCKRELTAGLVRELEEKKTIVMPCVIDDCDIPLFLKDKLYADFRSSPDAAIALLDRSLARISNAFQGRIDKPEFHTDWSVDWSIDDSRGWHFRWTFVDHGHAWPYVILSECGFYGDEVARKMFAAAHAAGEQDKFFLSVLKPLVAEFETKPLTEIIDDQLERFVSWSLKLQNGTFDIIYTYRRLGADNGMSTMVHLDNNLKMALEHLEAVTTNRPPESFKKA